MRLNNFSVRVLPGTEVPGGYVEMQHGWKYTLRLRNARGERCDARVEIDGKCVGTWRIGAHNSIMIERPVDAQKRFTFYKLGTNEAQQAQLSDDDNLGLVNVTFTPEMRVETVRETWQTPDSIYHLNAGDAVPLAMAAGSDDSPFVSYRGVRHSPGGTGLSGHSNQRFCDAGRITYDYSQQTVINLRLVVGDGNDIRPLTTQATPVPPRTW